MSPTNIIGRGGKRQECREKSREARSTTGITVTSIRAVDCQRWQTIGIRNQMCGREYMFVRIAGRGEFTADWKRSRNREIPTCTTLLRAAPASFTNFFTLKSILARLDSTRSWISRRQRTPRSLSFCRRALYTLLLCALYFLSITNSRVSAEWRHVVACA